MYILLKWTSSPPLKKEFAAFRKGIAALFYSTKSPTYPKEKTKSGIINITGAAKNHRLRLFFVIKGRYMILYRLRAPPSELECHKHKFKIGGLHNDYYIQICGRFCFGG